MTASPDAVTSTARRPEPFVGREAELALLDELLARASAGAGRVALLTGEAGIGKTTLAEEFLGRVSRRQGEVAIARGRCVEHYGTGEAYLPFLDALGSLLAGPRRASVAARLRASAPTWCLQLPSATVPEEREALQRATIGATQERMLRELGEALGTLAADAPLLVLLEGLQWADAPSVDLLRHLAHCVTSRRLLLLGTLRSAEIEVVNPQLRRCLLDLEVRGLVQQLSLPPLTLSHVKKYLDARFEPNRFSAAVAAFVHGRSEGHPLFVASLATYLAEHGAIRWESDHWQAMRDPGEIGLEAPAGLSGMLTRKIEGLAEPERLALQYASVIGREFLSTVLARLLDVEPVEVEERLARLDRVHRLVDTLGEEELPDGTLATRYRFTHGLYQELLYDGLVAGRRVALHLATAQQLVRHHGDQAPRIAVPLALHFERGRDFGAAVASLSNAGDNAARLYAYGEAVQHYRRALTLADRLPQDEQAGRVVALHGRVGHAQLAAGRFEQATESFTAMLERARATGGADPECAALHGLCSAHFFSHRIEELAIRAEESLRAAERSGREAHRLQALISVAMVLQDDGDLAPCRRLLDEIVQRARAAGERPALLLGLGNRGVVHYWQSEWEASERCMEEAVALASELRDGLMLLVATMFLGMARGNRGRTSEALATLEAAIAQARRNGDRFWLPRLANSIGWIHRELQDFERAIERDTEGLAVAREHGVAEAEASALLNIAIDHSLAGSRERAEQAFEQTPDSREVWFGWLYHMRLQAALAEHHLLRGDFPLARAVAELVIDMAGKQEAHVYIATAQRVLAEVALSRTDLAAARAHLDAALAELSGHPAPLVGWRVRACLARLCDASGDAEGARAAREAALACVREIAAHVTEPELRRTFLASRAVRDLAPASLAPAG